MIGHALMMIPFLVGGVGLPAPAAPDTVIRGSHTEAAGTRAWRLALPPHREEPTPLLVMLHGCTQDADDLARGTRMDALAGARGMAVLYPEQDPAAHPLRCWNWYEPTHQERDAGEPAILAGMIRAAVDEHGLDPARVFVAGMSAGGAMAAILAATYPDLVAGMASHSGVPFGIARGLPAATAALSGTLEVDLDAAAEAVRAAMGDRARPIPVLVIHGSEDEIVSPRNAAWFQAQGMRIPGPPLLRIVTVDGLGHAWSGGDPAGTWTDPRGPDASTMILDFFRDMRQGGDP